MVSYVAVDDWYLAQGPPPNLTFRSHGKPRPPCPSPWTCASSEPGPQEAQWLLFTFLDPCHHLVDKPGLDCWRMRDHVEDSPVSPVNGTWSSLQTANPQTCEKAQPRSAEPTPAHWWSEKHERSSPSETQLVCRLVSNNECLLFSVSDLGYVLFCSCNGYTNFVSVGNWFTSLALGFLPWKIELPLHAYQNGQNPEHWTIM